MTAQNISEEIAALQLKSKSAKTEVVKKALNSKIEKLQVELAKLTTKTEAKEKLYKAKAKVRSMSASAFNAFIDKLSAKEGFSFLKQMSSEEIKRDIARVAKPVGWRYRGRENMKKPLKRDIKAGNNVYYENRANRADVSRTVRLKEGGSVESNTEIFDRLKKGDKINITFNSGISRSNEKTLLVRSKNLVGKGKSYESEKITFDNVDNPSGVKYYAYKRKNDKVGFAMGDMAISNVVITMANKMAEGGAVDWVYWRVIKNDETFYEKTHPAMPKITNAKEITKEEYDRYKYSGEKEGIYAKGGKVKPKMVRSIFEEEELSYGKGGNVPSIAKKVAEVNALIERANKLNLTVTDTSGTWQAPLKYKPFKYVNGTLYEEYQEMDLYKHNKGKGTTWETKKGKILKSNMEYDSPLNDVARMYRKALKQYESYGYAKGGKMAYGGGVGSYKTHKIGETVEVWGIGGKSKIMKIIGFQDGRETYILESEDGKSRSYTPKKYIANLSGEFPYLEKEKMAKGGEIHRTQS